MKNIVVLTHCIIVALQTKTKSEAEIHVIGFGGNAPIGEANRTTIGVCDAAIYGV